MAAAAALAVVKQIQALADGPPTPEMRECLGQVVSSLLFFLDHPDSRVRLNAARTLLKLSAGYVAEMKSLDVSRARQAINRCKIAELEGRLDEDTQELRQLLSKFLGEEGEGDRPVVPATSSTVPSDHAKHADRGQVILKVSEQADGKVRAAMLEKIVALPGVVSVTFEGLFVIVSTLSVKIAADASFLADLLSAVKAQGVEGVSLVSTSSPPTAASSSAAPAESSTAASSSDPAHAEAEVEEDEEPAYLDDDEDDIVAPTNKAAASVPGRAAETASVGSANPGGPQWTFFSQSNWMTGRRIQEFDDDPSIAARLAKAKRREEERKAEERSRLGRLSSWFGGGR